MFRPTPQGPLTRLRMASTFLGRPVYAVSAYAFADLLIDTGPPQRAGQLVEWCRGSAVRRVILTHHHEDHVGGAAALQEELGLPVLAPANAVPILAEGLRMPLYRKAVWRTPRPFRAEPLGSTVEGEGYRLRVIPTPGHAFTHVCLFDEERRWLFSELVKKSRVLSWTVEAPGVEEAGQGRGVPPCGWDVEGLEGKPDFLR
ncbi:MAG TPA: MBL fold metallo-hydrolase, partial [Thermoanaerobaculia bacterium]|nr:MBL fold metallo-hydrolase [Thermoanaerobaculia bacterium]